MLKKQKQKMLKLNLNPKKEFLKFVIGNLIIIVLSIALIFIFKSLFYLAVLFIGVLLFSYAFFYRYTQFEEDKRKRLEVEFVEVFSYLRIYLINKETVYSALTKANEYTSKEMNEKINEFLLKIDEDKSIIPFLEFGKYFHNKIIEEVMISLYQMVDGGWSNEESLNNRYKKMSNLNLLTLVGSGYLMLVMLIVIVTVIGEMTNGF